MKANTVCALTNQLRSSFFQVLNGGIRVMPNIDISSSILAFVLGSNENLGISPDFITSKDSLMKGCQGISEMINERMENIAKRLIA
jgi:hypothetical protein